MRSLPSLEVIRSNLRFRVPSWAHSFPARGTITATHPSVRYGCLLCCCEIGILTSMLFDIWLRTRSSLCLDWDYAPNHRGVVHEEELSLFLDIDRPRAILWFVPRSSTRNNS
eukprot:scaffold34606_cov192-Amphora_coffeaeformis.AAC.9